MDRPAARSRRPESAVRGQPLVRHRQCRRRARQV